MDFIPVPEPGEGLRPHHSMDAIIGLLGNHNSLVGPSGEDTLLIEYDGVEYLIPADVDAESATLTDGQGMNILADTDGDGRVDYVSAIDYNGNWSAWRWSGDNPTPEMQAISDIPPSETCGFEQEEWENKAENTPDQGSQNWNSRAWKCVERGEWG